MSTIGILVNTGKQYILQRKVGFATGQPWKDLVLRLFKSYIINAVPRLQILSDFTEATFAGYANLPLAPWTDAFYDSVNFWYYSDSVVCPFTSTDPTPQSIGGYYITDPGNTVLIAYGVYGGLSVPTPVTINQGQSIAEQIQLQELSQYNN